MPEFVLDFADPKQPFVESVTFDFDKQGYNIIVVDTGGSHADLTDEYATIPREMKAAAAVAGKNYLSEIDADELYNLIPKIRAEHGERAALRALHFFEENARVAEQVTKLKENDFNAFLTLINESGNSSFAWLQNIFTTKNVKEQGIALALALTKNYIKTIDAGARRVHGGGFAGTILTFLPENKTDSYIKMMEPVFGKHCAQGFIDQAAGLRPIPVQRI